VNDINLTAVVTAPHAKLNSDVAPGVVHATVPSRQTVVVAEITSPATPGKAWLSATGPPPGWKTTTELAKT
jgi:hypothetical protein